MKRLVFLALLSLFTQACSDAFADRLRRGGTRSRGSPKGSIGADVIKAPFADWVLTYEGPDFGATVWNSTEGSVNTTSDGTNDATGGATTSGLTAAGTGPFTDQGVAAAVENRYRNASDFPAVANAQNIHVRMVIRWNTIAANDWVYHYNGGGTNNIQGQTNSTTSYRTRWFIGHTAYDCAVTIAASTWYLLDMYFEDLGTDGDCTVFINGTQTDFAASGLDPIGLTGGGTWSILGEESSPTAFSTEDATIVFWGIRTGTGTLIDETTHDAHVASLGL